MKWHNKRKTNPDYHNTNIFSYGFWANRGYSPIDAQNKVHDMYKRCVFNNKDFNIPSKQSISFINFVIDNTHINEDDVIREYKVGKYSTDFSIKNTNIIIEYYGDFWHHNPALYEPSYINEITGYTSQEKWEYDNDRISYIQKMGFDVIVVWENDFKDDPFKALGLIKEKIYD